MLKKLWEFSSKSFRYIGANINKSANVNKFIFMMPSYMTSKAFHLNLVVTYCTEKGGKGSVTLER